MSDAKHSPAPWHVSKHTDSRMALIYDADGFEVARVCYPNREANAALIAQAPEMREKITRLRAEVDFLTKELEVQRVFSASHIKLVKRAEAERDTYRVALMEIAYGDFGGPEGMSECAIRALKEQQGE